MDTALADQAVLKFMRGPTCKGHVASSLHKTRTERRKPQALPHHRLVAQGPRVGGLRCEDSPLSLSAQKCALRRAEGGGPLGGRTDLHHGALRFGQEGALGGELRLVRLPQQPAQAGGRARVGLGGEGEPARGRARPPWWGGRRLEGGMERLAGGARAGGRRVQRSSAAAMGRRESAGMKRQEGKGQSGTGQGCGSGGAAGQRAVQGGCRERMRLRMRTRRLPRLTGRGASRANAKA